MTSATNRRSRADRRVAIRSGHRASDPQTVTGHIPRYLMVGPAPDANRPPEPKPSRGSMVMCPSTSCAHVYSRGHHSSNWSVNNANWARPAAMGTTIEHRTGSMAAFGSGSGRSDHCALTEQSCRRCPRPWLIGKDRASSSGCSAPLQSRHRPSLGVNVEIRYRHLHARNAMIVRSNS